MMIAASGSVTSLAPRLPASADFDHALYLQVDAGHRAPKLPGWRRSRRSASSYVRVGAAGAIIDPDRGLRFRTIRGEAPNADVWVS